MKSEILIVEDDIDGSDILMESFKQLGYTSIRSFSETEKFLSYISSIENLPSKVIILDYHLPAFNGFQLLAYLKRKVSTTDFKIILQSGSGSEALKVKCLKAGALDFVEKNYSPEALKKFALKVVDLVQTGNYIRE